MKFFNNVLGVTVDPLHKCFAIYKFFVGIYYTKCGADGWIVLRLFCNYARGSNDTLGNN